MNWKKMNNFECLNVKRFFNKNLGSSQRYTAFSLAEVLITLGIIGVIAAISIPSLMNNISDKQNKVALKENYSIISQAFTRLLTDNSNTATNLCTSNDFECFMDLMGEHLTFIKKCNIGEAGCWPAKTKYLYNKDSTSDPYSATKPSVILKNGASIGFEYGDSNCNSNWFNQITGFVVCGTIAIDVNGLKQPNTRGRDIFIFWVLKDKLMPLGSKGDIYDGRGTNYCDTNANFSPNGYSCAFKYLME